MDLYNANEFQEVLEQFIKDDNLLMRFEPDKVEQFAEICVHCLSNDENPTLIPPVIRAAKHLQIEPNAAAIKQYLNKDY